MICKKCGKPVPNASAFCPNCGCNLKEKRSQSSEEQVPLQILLKQIAKHKLLVIILLITIGISFAGYYIIKKNNEKKKAEIERMMEMEHLHDIVGTYTYSSYYNDVTLELDVDNSARLTINGNSSRQKTYLGYWREKKEGLPIEIDFSDSFEIHIGNKVHSYCRELYLYNDRLWESMSAIRSSDYAASARMIKEDYKN